MMITCPYCGKDAPWFHTSTHVYGRDFGPIYHCIPCDARVSCHKDRPGKPMGTLANAELRELRQKAHAAFDPIWLGKLMKRRAAYRWLARALGENEVHIGESDESRCRAIIALASQKHEELRTD